MSATKPKHVRLYLPHEEAREVEKLAEELGQAESWVASTFLRAALKAVREKGHRFPMPLRFSIEEAVPHPKAKAA